MRLFSSSYRCLVWVILATLVGTGCTRKFYRKRTDDDVVGVMTEKNKSPLWAIENWHIYPDPRARFADPDNPDRPLKPPDDPAARALTPDPQPRSAKKTGIHEGDGYLAYLEAWTAENREKKARRPFVARSQAPYGGTESGLSPTFEKVLRSEESPYTVSLEQACELSLFNSREFQDRREDLYASALPVTLQRFSFVAQFAATEEAVREVTGRKTSEGSGDRWNATTSGSMSKLFPSGATLLVKLANKLVVELGTNSPRISFSSLTAELTQPLLSGGGYAYTMEDLTQAERDLLYAVRSYARFRKIYYTYLAGGNDNLFNSPYSLAGLTLRGIGPTLSASGQGYYPTLLLTALERNEVENIAGLERFWKTYQAFEEGGDVSRLQVDQVEQQLLRGRSQLLQRRLDLQNGLDQFKIQLGLPTRLPLELDDGPLSPIFGHLDRFNAARDEFDAVRRVAGDYNESIRRPLLLVGSGLLSTTPIDIALRPRVRTLFTDSPAVRGTRFREAILNRWLVWEQRDDDAVKDGLRKLADTQRELLDRKARLEVQGQTFSVADEKEITRIRSEINLGRFELSLRQYERKPWNKVPGARMAREQANAFREVVDLFILVMGEAREERLTKLRASWPDLPPATVNGIDVLHDDLDKSLTVATQTALSNRLELMNARAQLVDAWRQIAVKANSLMGILNVGYNYSSSTPSNANTPVNFGAGRDTHQLTINGELPLVRRAERNEYRTSLIAYQRQRRALQATEDFILNDVRSGLRQLRVQAENFKIQQRAVEVAYAQVENSLEALQAPPDPAAGRQSAAAAAALTQQLLNAQSSLLQSQNSLYTAWINYLIARMQFYRELELLPIDPRGVWTDEYIPEQQSELSGPQPPAAAPAGSERPERLPDPQPVGRQPTAPAWDGILRVGGAVVDPVWKRADR